MRLSPDWPWTRPICPGDAQSLQSPCRLPPSLASFVSQSQTPSAHSDNRARHSNNKNPARGAPQAGLVAGEWPCTLPHAPRRISVGLWSPVQLLLGLFRVGAEFVRTRKQIMSPHKSEIGVGILC